ncbi:MAG: hypothetical protein QOH89_2159, partial [Pseudonocardiales bacterium]|nr:hypothetical protein [Pseudonocardiales bacterium]
MTDFDSMDSYLALPRVTDLALSPDGGRLVATIGRLDEKGAERINALWELDPAGSAEARQLTRSDKGESAPAFCPDRSLLFVSRRGAKDDDEPAALWRLPVSGEPEQVHARPGGVAGVIVARDAGAVVVSGNALPGSASSEDDEKRRTARKDAKVRAALHTESPVRFWDHDLGPAVPHVYWVGRLPAETAPGAPVEEPEWRDLSPDAGPPNGAGDDVTVSPDGRHVLRTEDVPDGPAGRRTRLVLTEVATGETRVLVDDPTADVGGG